ncbi:uncharacterized protein LOC114474573 [Gouania willdenowi]|uniref:uncharacterized protein LOC114474573 n=1 Tax=Gouania willdenowi TaxID=441366 RepID=UPI0010555B23|nr:spermatogenesis- and oogenesis-specific basic helix-loop-helix-containing protein 2 [Gouania willdenowi]
MMEQAALNTFQVCESSTPEQFGYMVFTTVTNEFNDQDAGQRNEPQTSLHSRKEQKRRLQIKTSCQRLCQLLPFVNGPLDTATTLELTVKYISYLKDILPPHILSKAIETVEKNSNSPNTQRKPTVLKSTAKRTRQVPTKKSNHDRCLRRSCYQRILKKEILPAIIITNPLMMVPKANTHTQTMVRVSPTLLDKSTVPWGQMLPMCQNQSVVNSFPCIQNNWTNPAATEPTSSMSNQIVLPQMNQDPTLGQILWDGRSEYAAPATFQPVTFDQLYNQPPQNAASNHLMSSELKDSPVAGPSPTTVPAEDFINQLLTSPAKLQSASASTWDDFPGSETRPVPEPLCDSRLFPENDLGLVSPLTDAPCDAVSPFWLDLFCTDDLCLSDPVDPPFLPETGFI